MTQLLSDNTNTPMMSEPRKGTAIVIGGGFVVKFAVVYLR
jgi:hypothetical protein